MTIALYIKSICETEGAAKYVGTHLDTFIDSQNIK